MQKRKWAALTIAACCALAWNMPSSIASSCSASYAINLTVELGPELTNSKRDLLIELRQGAIGNSKVIDRKEFVGRSGTVTFSGLCVGPHFIAVGNGEKVAVGPIHALYDGQNLRTTVRVAFSQGNMGTMSRSRL